MNESSRDTSTVFGKAAGTAMGIGVGAAGVGALAYTGKAMGTAAINGVKSLNSSETHAAFKNVQRNLGERLVNNMDDIGRGVTNNIKGTGAATQNIQRNLGERLVNNMDDMGKGAKNGINRILKTFSKVK